MNPQLNKTFSVTQKRLNSLLDLLLPPRCIGTGDIVNKDGLISSKLWQSLHFITAPYCAKCGISFEIDLEDSDLICGECLEKTPNFDLARSPLLYNDYSRKVILGFKYGDQLHSVKTFGHWLNSAAQEMLPDADLIIPVPLHYKRLWWRRFNQASLLAQALSERTNLPHHNHILKRIQETKPHRNISADQREKNVKNAFSVSEKYIDKIKGKNIILIDDVYTTGATLNACTRILKKHGCKKVYALSLARVPKK